jgi:hypothetical protein
VLPCGSVAVAVTICPTATDRADSKVKVAVPLILVVTLSWIPGD